MFLFYFYLNGLPSVLRWDKWARAAPCNARPMLKRLTTAGSYEKSAKFLVAGRVSIPVASLRKPSKSLPQQLIAPGLLPRRPLTGPATLFFFFPHDYCIVLVWEKEVG